MADAQLPTKVLIVDDDQAFSSALEAGLEKHKIKAFKAPVLETAFYLFNQQRFEVVIVEMEFAELPGLALVQKWRNHEVVDKRFTGIIATSSQKRNAADEGLIREMGDVELICKPFTAINLIPYLTRSVLARAKALQFYEFKGKILDAHVNNGNHDKAIAALKDKLSTYGRIGLDELFKLYETSGKHEEGLTIISKQLEERPSDITLLNAQGRILMKMGKFAEAKVCMEKADQLAPMNIERINEMGEMYLQLKEPEKSVKKMGELVKLNPEKKELKFELLNKLYDHNFAEHGRVFARDNAGPGEIVRHFNNKGVMMAKSGYGEDALQQYLRAIEFYPKHKDNYRIHFNIALSYVNKKDPESMLKAKEHLRKCLDLEPTFEKGKHTLEQLEKILASKKAG